jgi:hypothetical protein
VHAEVFQTHPLASEAQNRLKEARRHTAASARRCYVCGRLVGDPNDYLGLGYLVTDRAHRLFQLNYAHFHRSCLVDWIQLPSLITALEELDNSDAWQGNSLKDLVHILRSLCRTPEQTHRQV